VLLVVFVGAFLLLGRVFSYGFVGVLVFFFDFFLVWGFGVGLQDNLCSWSCVRYALCSVA